MPYSDDGHDVPEYIHGEKKRRQWSHIWNSEYKQQKDKGKSDKEAEHIAFAAANSVTGKALPQAYEALLAKAKADDARAFADAIIALIEKNWEQLPALVRPSLEAAQLSGVGKGMLQIDVSNSALLSSSNVSAMEYARERAAEMVGMKRDEEGNLAENKNAKWAISDTTRDRIREIVADAFTKETSIAEIAQEIEGALQAEAANGDIFSPERARLIAETEVANAQSAGNYSVWNGSGLVTHLKWLTSEDEKVCEVCDENDNVVVPIGRPFPSGDLYPGAHPRCRCVLVVDAAKN